MSDQIWKKFDNIKVRRFNNHITISIKWYDRSVFGIIIGTLVAIILSLSVVSVLSDIYKFENPGPILVLVIYTLIISFIDIILFCYILINYFDRAYIKVTNETISVYHKPIPTPFVNINLSNVKNIYSNTRISKPNRQDDRQSSKHEDYIYEVNAKTFSETYKTIIRPNTGKEKMFITKVLTDYLKNYKKLIC